MEAGNPGEVGRADARRWSRASRSAAGAQVARGELLLTLEAMKMETAVRAESDGEVLEVLVRAGPGGGGARTCWCVLR